MALLYLLVTFKRTEKKTQTAFYFLYISLFPPPSPKRLSPNVVILSPVATTWRRLSHPINAPNSIAVTLEGSSTVPHNLPQLLNTRCPIVFSP